MSEKQTPVTPRRRTRKKTPKTPGDNFETELQTSPQHPSLFDRLGPKWEAEELKKFFDAYQQYGKEKWEEISSKVGGERTPSMIAALFELNKSFLNSTDVQTAEGFVNYHNETLVNLSLLQEFNMTPRRAKPTPKRKSTRRSTPRSNKRKSARINRTPKSSPTKTPPRRSIRPRRLFDEDSVDETPSRDFSRREERVPRKEQIVLSPLPSDMIVDAGATNAPKSPSADFEQNKSLPPKLRGKKRQPIHLNKINIEILNGKPDEKQVEAAQQLATQFSKILSTSARRFCICEWFYSSIDYGFFHRNDFEGVLNAIGLGNIPKLTRYEWNEVRNVIGNKFGRPRRFSQKFLEFEIDRLNKYRNAVRSLYTKKDITKLSTEEFFSMEDYEIAEKLQIGERVLVHHPTTHHLHLGTIAGCGENSYTIHFDSSSLGEMEVADTLVTPIGKIRILSTEESRKRMLESIQPLDDVKTPPTKKMRLFEEGTPRTPTNQIISADSIDVVQLADVYSKLKKKEEYLNQLTKINNEAEQQISKFGEKYQFDPETKIKCAWLIVQLKNINAFLNAKLARRPTLYTMTPLTTTTPRVRRRTSSTKCSELFEQNRDKAIELVENVKNQLVKQIGNDPNVANSTLFANNSGNTKRKKGHGNNIKDVIASCVAFLLHLQTCVEDSTFTAEDANITLNAAEMALKPQQTSSTNAIIYEDIKNVIKKIKLLLFQGNAQI